MPILNIVPAQRDAARLVIGLSGLSGDGKTYSAIMLAYGLAGYDARKVGFIDTENKRGRLYANILKKHPTHPTDEPFWIADLEPPFTPQRCADAIKEFNDFRISKGGEAIEVLVFDSVTHEYEGSGGVMEIAELQALGNGPKKRPNWALAKKLHKDFMNVLLQSNAHVIPCIRAREKGKEVMVDGKKVFQMDGVPSPIQERNFMFEMTASLMMWNEGRAQSVLKCPEELRPMLGRQEGYITSEDGYAIRQWLAEGGEIDQKRERLRNALRNETTQGEAHFLACWEKLKPGQQRAVGKEVFETLLAAAKEFDQVAEHQRQTDEPGDQNADTVNALLNDED